MANNTGNLARHAEIGSQVAEYCESFHLNVLFRNLVQQIIKERPENPLQFLMEHLQNFWAPKVIIIGAPASGKGTQCELLVNRYGMTYIGTGDLLRSEVSKGTRLGHQVKEYLDAGQLVPDEVIINLVSKRVMEADCQHNGWVMDGYPRTAEQAQALRDLGVEPDLVFFLNVPDEDVEERVTGRWSDPVTGKIYHLRLNPPPANIRQRLVQRLDDSTEKVKVLLDAFHAMTEPILYSHYDPSIVTEVDGTEGKAAVFAKITKVLDDMRTTIEAKNAESATQ